MIFLRRNPAIEIAEEPERSSGLKQARVAGEIWPIELCAQHSLSSYDTLLTLRSGKNERHYWKYDSSKYQKIMGKEDYALLTDTMLHRHRRTSGFQMTLKCYRGHLSTLINCS